jgi:glutaminase
MREPLTKDWQTILNDISSEVRPLQTRGRVADYIPALARVPAEQFGMALATVDGHEYWSGEAEVAFSVQSISKVFTLILALNALGDKLWERIGREPSGNPFNSLVQLEHEEGIPRNPFINAGALVVTDCVISHSTDPKADILACARLLSGNPEVQFDPEVAVSERTASYRNMALASFIKSFGNLTNNVREVLNVYCHQCSLSMDCRSLARSFLLLANSGKIPATGEALMLPKRSRRINSLMLTCGMYDAVGDFAFRVGLPAKSGVGGGIVAVVPGQLTLCVWSPGLDRSGNSLAGVRALELFTQRTGLSIF